jgi:hypothetical protein
LRLGLAQQQHQLQCDDKHHSAPEALIDAIRAVAKDQRHADAQIAQRIAVQAINGDKSPVEELSSREFEVFAQLARGQSEAGHWFQSSGCSASALSAATAAG